MIQEEAFLKTFQQILNLINLCLSGIVPRLGYFPLLNEIIRNHQHSMYFRIKYCNHVSYSSSLMSISKEVFKKEIK